MRPEKSYLVKEASEYLSRLIIFFSLITKELDSVETNRIKKETFRKRSRVSCYQKQFFNYCCQRKKSYRIFQIILLGTLLLLPVENDVSGVAKTLTTFNKESKKVSVKAGSLDDRVLTPEEVKNLSNLPSLEILQSKLLSLLNTPATQVVSVLSAPHVSKRLFFKLKRTNHKLLIFWVLYPKSQTIIHPPRRN